MFKFHWRNLTSSPALWLALYFAFNLSLTLFNKSILLSFPFPYSLTAIHALFGSLGLYILRHRRIFPHRTLTTPEKWRVALFSALYAVNILVSNLSLQMVTVPASVCLLELLARCINKTSQFHQVVRASSPFFTILLSILFLDAAHQSSRAKLVSLVPVVFGVGLACVYTIHIPDIRLILETGRTAITTLHLRASSLHSSAHSSHLSKLSSPTYSNHILPLIVHPRTVPNQARIQPLHYILSPC
jgi:hypothetical protein